MSGKVLVQALPGGSWQYGDRVRLRGYLRTPFESENFSYRDYLAQQGTYSIIKPQQIERLAAGQGNLLLAGLYSLRTRAVATAYRLWPDPEASLLAGVLLGVDKGIPQPVLQAFQDTGTAHIIAISGFNMAILSGLLAATLGRWLGKRRRFLAAALSTLLLIAYALLVGADPSVVRAALMGMLSLFAASVGRRQDGYNTLAFVAALMALVNPFILWSVSFQLSFMATLGLVVFADPLSSGLERLASRFVAQERLRSLSKPVSAYLLFTLAALIMTLPVMVYHFQRLSLIALLANPAILPVQPAMMGLGGAALLLGLVYLPAGKLLGALAWPFAAYTIRAVEGFSRIKAGTVGVAPDPRIFVGVYLVLLLGLVLGRGTLKRLWSRLWGEGSGQRIALLLVGLAALSAVTWTLALGAPDGRLHLTLLDVGDGDALLIQSPTGRYVLVDGGPSTRQLSDGLGRRLPLFQRELDWLVVAAAGEGQLAALPRTLDWIPARSVLWAGPAGGSYSAQTLRSYLSERQVPLSDARPGQSLDLGQDARLEVLAVGKRGAVLLLEWQGFSALLPVGADFATLEALQAQPDLAPLTALLLAESGYAPLNPPEWIAGLHPQVVLLSVAAGNRDGLPSAETLQAVQGYNLLRTDRNGWIELTTDGEQMWVEVERR